jgi:hypothetical protein
VYNLLLLTKRVSTSIHTLVVKTVEFGVLKHHIHSLKSLCIGQKLHSFSITNWGIIVTKRENYCEQLSRSSDLITFSAGREINGFLVSAKKKAFLHDSFDGNILCRGLRLNVPQTHVRQHISVGISWQKFTVKTQESWKTLNVTLNRLLPAVSNKLFEYFHNILWNGWMFFLKKVENTFSISCNYTFELVYHIICTF